MFGRSIEFPTDSVLVKTLSLEMKQGDQASRRRIETQVLHFDGRDWRGYAYAWNDDESDAVLVEGEARPRIRTIADAEARGGLRQQPSRYPSRTAPLPL